MKEIAYPIFFALTLTLLVETLIYYFLKRDSLTLIITVLIMNLVLNLGMNVGLAFYVALKGMDRYMLVLIIVEVLIVLIETLIIYAINKTPLLRTFLFATIANGISLALGLLNNHYVVISPTQNSGLIFSIIFILILCISLYSLFLFVPANKKQRHEEWHTNDENNAEHN